MSHNNWPIIIGGCYRSGTSLVRRILNAHSRIYCGPEIKFFRDLYSDYIDDPVGHGRFMASARSILAEPELLDILGRAFVEMHERASEQAHKRRWADKNPENVLYLAQWEQLLGQRWLLVQVVRNPLDTLASIKEVRFPKVIPGDLGARIELYQRYTLAGLEFGARHPDRYYRLKYEQLVCAPDSVLKSLMQWLGEKLEPGQLAFNQFSQQSGLEDPKIAGTTSVHAESVGRWQTMLSGDEATRIWRETGELWRRIDPEGQFRPPTLQVEQE